MSKKPFEKFIDAVKNGNVKTVERLWQQEWIEMKDIDGRRPIHWACDKGRSRVVQFFLGRGSDKEAAAKDGRRPIHFACQNGYDDIVRLLLDKCCDVEAATKDGLRPIHLACQNGHVYVVKLLVEKGCQIEATDLDGRRPIHLACEEGHAVIIKLLVDQGCIIDAQTNDGETPLTFAQQLESDECAEIINKAQEERKKDEFQIFHFPTFSIVSRKYKISDLANAVEKIKADISCINRPVVVCHLTDPLRRLGPSQKMFKIVSDRLQYAEYVVEEMRQTDYGQCRMMAELRDWDVCAAINASALDIKLQIIRPTDQSKWSRYATVSLDVLSEPLQLVNDTVNMLVMDNARGADVKTAFVDFQRFAYCVEVFDKLKENEIPNDDVIDWLNRWVTTRKEMLTFYDSNREKLTDLDSLILCSTESAPCRISVLQKVPKQVKFIPTLSPSQMTKDCVAKILSQEYILIRCVTDDQPDWIIPRSECKTVEHVTNRLRPLVLDGNKKGRLMLVSADGELSNETKLDELGFVIHYVVVLPYENIKKMAYIGIGGFGNIVKCQIGNENAVYAVKEMAKIVNDSNDSINTAMKEVSVAARIGSHPNVMKYLRFFETDLEFYIVMDCMKMSLDRFIKNNEPLEEATITSLSRQILKGLKHLHDHKVIHRNVKCKKVLLDENGCVKLCSFGISKCQNVNTSKARISGGFTQIGTYRYMAPELLSLDRPDQYGQSSDIWGFGMLMVEMITRRLLYPGFSDAQMWNRIERHKKVEYEFPPMYRRKLKEFVDSCLVYDPADRPTCAKLLQSTIFTELVVGFNGIASSNENAGCGEPVMKTHKQNVSEEIVVRCITNEKEPWTILRKDYKTVADVKTKLSELVLIDNKVRRLMLIDSNGDLSDGIAINELDEHVYYDVVWRYENIKKMEYIGKGGCGLISKCEIGNEKAVYAVKEMAKIVNDANDSINTAMKEVSVAARIRSHPNVMKYHRFFETDLAFYIVMDCMKESLYAHIRQHRPLAEPKIISFARQILEGLKHLHDHKVIHRDVKCRNVLLDEEGCVKLCDFGVSKCQNVNTTKAPMFGGYTQIGTPGYRAPDLVSLDRPDEYGNKSDIWGFGLLMVEMIIGDPDRYNGEMERQIEKVKKVEYDFPRMYRRELKEFVDSCLVYDPVGRATCAELLQSIIFKPNFCK